jgi:quercetin dioxygenase-like cupin family protein
MDRHAVTAAACERNQKELDLQITRKAPDTNRGPADAFTGTVYIDSLAAPRPPSRVGAAVVHFTPSARTAWHTHPYGQTIFVTEGIGRCQRRGGAIEELRPGDRVYFEPGEEHWHGAAPSHFMTHVAIHEADDSGSSVTWGEHVADQEYDPGAS